MMYLAYLITAISIQISFLSVSAKSLECDNRWKNYGYFRKPKTNAVAQS